ncbi:MAG: retroviral-like aspartic protease family protein [Pyrinomonadaceae bacterium]
MPLWINGHGPYNFVIDTGAGATIISSRVATQAAVAVIRNRSNKIAGLSGALSTNTAAEVRPQNLAIGDPNNFLPSNGTVLMADILPSDIDGLLDPTEGYWPLGYVIDFPGRELSSFDPALNSLQDRSEPEGGAIVPWVRDSNSRRPYVVLDDGQTALLDTGSEFGLALSDNPSVDSRRSSNRAVRDLGGGTISARRVAPMTVAIGSLSLQRVPTDVISGAERGAPVLLGRAALRPFRISFDPISRLIEIAPR